MEISPRVKLVRTGKSPSNGTSMLAADTSPRTRVSMAGPNPLPPALSVSTNSIRLTSTPPSSSEWTRFP